MAPDRWIAPFIRRDAECKDFRALSKVVVVIWCLSIIALRKFPQRSVVINKARIMKRRGHYTYTLPIWLSTDNLESLLFIPDDGMLRVTKAQVRKPGC